MNCTKCGGDNTVSLYQVEWEDTIGILNEICMCYTCSKGYRNMHYFVVRVASRAYIDYDHIRRQKFTWLWGVDWKLI
jgi:hypothetical protein